MSFPKISTGSLDCAIAPPGTTEKGDFLQSPLTFFFKRSHFPAIHRTARVVSRSVNAPEQRLPIPRFLRACLLRSGTRLMHANNFKIALESSKADLLV